MVPLLKFYFHDDCRIAAAESLPYLLDCAKIQGPGAITVLLATHTVLLDIGTVLLATHTVLLATGTVLLATHTVLLATHTVLLATEY